MSNVQEVLKIVESLTQHTREGKITWERDGDSGEDQYLSETERFFYLAGSRDFDGEPPYRLQVWRSLKRDGDDDSVSNLKLLDAESTGALANTRDSLERLLDAIRYSVAGLKMSLFDEVMADLSDDTPF